MIALSVAELKMFSPESDIFLWIKAKKKKKNFFVESLDQCRRLEVPEKVRNVFCDEPTSVWPQGVTQHRIFFKFFSISLGFSGFFSLVFRTSNFWSLRNLIKQWFHSRLLDMRLVIANSALRASLAIYHLISNARSGNNNCYIFTVLRMEKKWRVISRKFEKKKSKKRFFIHLIL